jgi:hypothetical protein
VFAGVELLKLILTTTALLIALSLVTWIPTKRSLVFVGAELRIRTLTVMVHQTVTMGVQPTFSRLYQVCVDVV